jgi:hypothetical protein
VLPAHPGALVPLLGEAALVDHPDHPDRTPRGSGDQFVGEHGLDLGLHIAVIPRGDVDELLECRDLAVADVQGDRLDALALGADHQPFNVGVGVILSLLLAEQGSEALVKLDQSLGRGAHVVLGHGGSLHTVARSDDEPARLSSASLQISDELERIQ